MNVGDVSIGRFSTPTLNAHLKLSSSTFFHVLTTAGEILRLASEQFEMNWAAAWRISSPPSPFSLFPEMYLVCLDKKLL